MYIQIINNYVNLIGGAAEGLPLPESYLADNPNVICLDAEDYEELPEIGQYYDAENDEFLPWSEAPQEDWGGYYKGSVTLESLSARVDEIQESVSELTEGISEVIDAVRESISLNIKTPDKGGEQA